MIKKTSCDLELKQENNYPLQKSCMYTIFEKLKQKYDITLKKDVAMIRIKNYSQL